MADLAERIEEEVAASIRRYDAELGEAGADRRAAMMDRFRTYHAARIRRNMVVVVARRVGGITLLTACCMSPLLFAYHRWNSTPSPTGSFRDVVYPFLWLLLPLVLVPLSIQPRFERILDRYLGVRADFSSLTFAALSTLTMLLLSLVLEAPWRTLVRPSAVVMTMMLLVALSYDMVVTGPFLAAVSRLLFRRHHETRVIECLLRALNDATADEPAKESKFSCKVDVRIDKGPRWVADAEICRDRFVIGDDEESWSIDFGAGYSRSQGTTKIRMSRGLFGRRIDIAYEKAPGVLIRLRLWPAESASKFDELQKFLRQLEHKTFHEGAPQWNWAELSSRHQIIELLDYLQNAVENMGAGLRLDQQTASFFAEQRARRAEAVRRWKEAALNPKPDTLRWLLERMRHCLRVALAGDWDAFDAETPRPRTKREWLLDLKRWARAAIVASAPFVVLVLIRRSDPEALKESYFSTAAVIWAVGIVITTLDPSVAERMKTFGAVFPFPGAKKEDS